MGDTQRQANCIALVKGDTRIRNVFRWGGDIADL
jgi:hypothetical protein